MAKKEASHHMTVEEAKAFRASLYVAPKAVPTEQQKREQFRLFWAKAKKKYRTRTKGLEKILWLHLQATKNDEPENFEKGLQHFGLKKIG
jgi:hypothetical protein